MNSRSELLEDAEEKILFRIKNKQSIISLLFVIAIFLVVGAITYYSLYQVNDVEKVRSYFFVLVPVFMSVIIVFIFFCLFVFPFRPKFSSEELERVFQEILTKRKQRYVNEKKELEEKLEHVKEKLAKLPKSS